MRATHLAAFLGLITLGVVGAMFLMGRPSATRTELPRALSLPPEVAQQLEGLSPQAREAYVFALERPDVLQYIPCYCGCSGLGHTSNLSCFVKPGVSAGGVVLEAHGAT